MKAVGARLPRYDGVCHVTGRTLYVDDVRVGKTLWVKALRSPHHHATITKLDTAKAETMNGVRAAKQRGPWACRRRIRGFQASRVRGHW